MKRWTRRGLVGLVGLLGLVACSTASDPSPDASEQDASPGDASEDGTTDTSPPLDASTDAPLEASLDASDASDDASDGEASDSGDADVADATDSGDGGSTSDAGDAGDAGLPPSPLFAPGESGVAYQMRATCTVVASGRVGAVDSCCRQATFTETTTCDTVLREEPDGAGGLVVVVEPMQSCVATPSADTCTQSGTLPRCNSSGLACPFTTASYGAPSLVAGTYVRRTLATPKPTFADHYWSRCATAGMVPFTTATCSPANAVQVTTQRMAVFTRTGAGAFRIVRSWAQNAPLGACSVPSWLPGVQSLGSSTFVDGMSAQGGTFGIGAHGCTYELTKK